MEEKRFNREAIIAEYLIGDHGYRQLGAKYGLDFRKIHYWVSGYNGKIKPAKEQSKVK